MEYDKLSRALKMNDKFAPPTQQEFLDMIKSQDMRAVREVHQKIKKEYPKWQIVGNWQVTMLAEHEFAQKGNYAKAIDILNFLKEIVPGFWATYFNLGDYYEKTGRKELALINYRKSYELYPSYIQAKAKIDELSK